MRAGNWVGRVTQGPLANWGLGSASGWALLVGTFNLFSGLHPKVRLPAAPPPRLPARRPARPPADLQYVPPSE